MVLSSSNLLHDTQYKVLPSKNPGLELIMPLGNPLHCVFPIAPPEGEKTLSVLTLPEREKTVCTVPSRGGENSVCTGYIQSSSVQKCTYPRKVTKSASGGQTEAVPPGVGKVRLPPVNCRAHKRRIQVALQGMPKPIHSTLHSQQLRRL